MTDQQKAKENEEQANAQHEREPKNTTEDIRFYQERREEAARVVENLQKKDAEKILRENGYSKNEIDEFLEEMTEEDYEDLKANYGETKTAENKDENQQDDQTTEAQEVFRAMDEKASKIADFLNSLPEGLEIDEEKRQNPDRYTAECLCTAADLADEGKMDEAVGMAMQHGIVKLADTEHAQTCRQRLRDQAALEDDDEATLLGRINASMERIAGKPDRLNKDISKIGPAMRELTRIAYDWKYNKDPNRVK